ncbi:MAG: SulP family inorganic anion transporter [Acutalibacteraceae bacterium]|nr:SulP family inorganic anion transporter [Acutalibacteraceae bacterium]
MKSFYLKPKFFSVMKKYSPEQFTKDIIAGVIVAIIALPLSIALALASGVEPACGIYTAIAAGFFVSLFGGSRIQIAGPTAAFASIVAGIVAAQGMDGIFIATILAGIMLILMGIFRFGALIKFIPHTITTGFTSGIALTIFIGQIKDFIGLTYADGVKPIETLEKIEANIEFIASFSWQALVVGTVSLAILVFYPKMEKRIPPSLVAVLVGALMVAFLPGFEDGVYTIRDLYTIPSGLPKVNLGGMNISFEKISAVLPDAFTIAVLAAIESLLSCVVADGMVNSRHNSNAELVGQGIGNIASVLFGGIPATGAIARTAANAKNGGRTPVAGMVHAIVLLLVLLFLMPYAGLIPMPTIAAILFIVAYNMSEWKKFVRIVKTAPKSDILILIVTFVLTVIFDLVVAIAVGMVLTAMLFMKRMSEETSVNGWKYIDPDTDADGIDLRVVPKDVRVYEISGPLFFGVADKIPEIMLKDYTRCLILRMRAVPSLDSTALNALELLYKKCEKQGVRLILSHVNEQPLQVMQKSGFYKMVGEENFCAHIDDALEKSANLKTNG